ncbi:TonB-dependent receptor [Sphingobacterium sp. MYb382]|uniref:TonB-dependent receptor n=1 Tax=Sphingobacterium sp. MYb382 TaxID=2745278 RepID=UPI0030A966E2
MRKLGWAMLMAFMVNCVIVYGQTNYTLTGSVKTATNTPLQGAKIKLHGTTTETATDDNGLFKFSKLAKGSYEVLISSLGYLSKSQTITLPQTNGPLTIILQEDTKQINSVRVEGKSIAKKIQESGFSVNIIEAKQYANINADVNQILNRSTGIKIREQGGLGSNYSLSLNGLSGNQVKFFIDGVPIEAFGSGMSFNNIPINIVERIEVYKGVVPAHLTSDALGGAINIITNRDRKKALDVSYSIGSFNTHRSAISGSYTEPKTGIHINANAYYNYSDNDYLMKTNPSAKVYLEVPNATYSGFDTLASARRFHDAYRSAMSQVEVGISKKKWADVFVLGLTYTNINKEIQTGATQDKVFGHLNEKSNSLAPSLRYRKDNIFIEGLSASVFANLAQDKSVVTDTSSYSTYRWNGLPDKRSYYPAGGERSTTKSIQHYSGYNNTVQTTLNYLINDQQSVNLTHNFNSNFRKSYNEIDPYNHTRDQSNRVNKQVLGLNYMHDFFNKKWRNQLFAKHYMLSGKVLDKAGIESTQNKNYTGYGIASSYFITENLGVKGSYENAYRLPGLVELYGDGTNIGPNEKLVPENSNNYNLGVFFSRRLDEKQQLNITAGAFYRDVKDYIHSTPPVDNGSGSASFRTYYNYGGIKVQGADFESTYSYADFLRFTVNLSYESAVDREQFVRGTNRAKITYNNRLPDKPWLYGNTDFIIGKNDVLGKDTRLEFNWYMQFVNEYSMTWSKLGDKSTNYYIPTQWIQNVGLTYSLKKGRYNITLESKNLTDRIAYDNAKLQKPGRSFSLKFRYNINIHNTI